VAPPEAPPRRTRRLAVVLFHRSRAVRRRGSRRKTDRHQAWGAIRKAHSVETVRRPTRIVARRVRARHLGHTRSLLAGVVSVSSLG